MSFLESQEAEELKNHIATCMKNDPPEENCGALILMSWMARHLTRSQFATLERIEREVGENESTAWLMLILGTARPEGSRFVAVA